MPRQKPELVDDNWCFACGESNPGGLHLQFESDDGDIVTTFQPERGHQGYRGILHGGITCTLLDEIMARAAIEYGKPAVTARLEVRYVRPASTGGLLEARGRITQDKGRMLKAEAELFEEGLGCVAKGKARLVPL